MKIRIVILLVCLLAFGYSTAQEDRLQVAASTSIIADVARNVGGDLVDVTSIIPIGADVHTFNPSPRDLTSITDADVIFVNGMGLEEGLLDLIEENAPVEPVVVSMGVEVLSGEAHSHDDDHEHDSEEHGDEDHSDEDHGDEDHGDEDHGDEDHGDEDHGDEDHGDEDHSDEDHGEEDHGDEDHGDEDHGDDDHDHDHEAVEYLGVLGEDADCGDGHAHDGEEGHDEDHSDDDHDHGPCDPHVWMNPANVMIWAENIAAAYAAADPDNAETYTANAQAYIAELDMLDDDVLALVESVPEENRVLVTNHDFLSYFAVAYDFEIVGTVIPAATTAAEVTPRSLQALIDVIEDEGVSAVFAETSDSTALAETIAEEVGGDFQVVQLYSGSLSEDAGADTYLGYMRANIEAITNALATG